MYDTLQHHGVKGMHWGVRKDRNKTRKKVKNMTDAELKSANERMRLENQYRELKHPNISRAKSTFIGGTIGGLSTAASLYTVNTVKKYGYKKFTTALLAATIYKNSR